MHQNTDNIVPRKLEILIDDNSQVAKGLITNDGTESTADGTITVGTHEYALKSALTGAVDEVLIEADVDDTLQNLKDLINSGRAEAQASQVLTTSGNASDADEVVVGAKTYTLVDALTEVKASQVLTFSGNPSNGQTVTIGGVVYTFVSSLSEYRPYAVLIGATQDATLQNLTDAINGASGMGSRYGMGTVAHPIVTAVADTDANTCTVTAIIPGEDTTATTETSGVLAWTGATLTGGVNPVANEVLIGADEDETLANLASAINGGAGEGTAYSTGTEASTEATAEVTGASELTATAIEAGTDGNALATTTDITGASWGDTTMTGGTVATPANEDAIATTLSTVAHTLLIEARVAGFAGNSIPFTENTDHHTVNGTGTLGASQEGGATIGSASFAPEGGYVTKVILKIPNYNGTETFVVNITDKDGDKLLEETAIEENEETAIGVGMVLSPEDKIVITASGVIEDDTVVEAYLR